MPRRCRSSRERGSLNRMPILFDESGVGPRRYSFWKPPRKCWEPMKFDNWCSRCPLLISCQVQGFTKSSLIHPALPTLMPLDFFFSFSGLSYLQKSLELQSVLPTASPMLVPEQWFLNLSVRQDRLGAVIQHTDSQIPWPEFLMLKAGIGDENLDFSSVSWGRLVLVDWGHTLRSAVLEGSS